eukprot:snap_masked-scaffold_62-processed-gene-0.24-mRNA-1 protein AED:1.00 eAED:1.00 QI:0/-1/0/0/-1/1/1/0/63
MNGCLVFPNLNCNIDDQSNAFKFFISLLRDESRKVQVLKPLYLRNSLFCLVLGHAEVRAEANL